MTRPDAAPTEQEAFTALYGQRDDWWSDALDAFARVLAERDAARAELAKLKQGHTLYRIDPGTVVYNLSSETPIGEEANRDPAEEPKWVADPRYAPGTDRSEW